ncbi:MAG: glycoside hydrolase family 16 protein [Prevotella sp.]|nr:glycoside hydrolase family 16 protein [Prevotella sp.]
MMAAVGTTAAPAQTHDYVPDGFKLVWQEDFNGTQLDENTWTIEVSGSGGGNQELQYYRRENVSVADGNLVLTARREDFQGRSFTSGRINSKRKTAFKHGLIQARIKMPKTANGLWPAYWMMGNDMDRYGWPRCGEIDIVEMGHFNAITGVYAGWQDRYFSGTLHYGPNATNEAHQQYSQEFTREQFENIVPFENDEYHLLTVYWDNDVLEMYYDLTLVQWEENNPGILNNATYFSHGVEPSTDPYTPGTYFQKPFFFIFNLAVGGSYTNIYDPAKITALPNAGDEARMYVDWVRVYQADDDADAQYLYVDADGNTVTNIPEDPEPQHQDDNLTELSGFATEALDENGETTFDFSDVESAVLISTSDGVRGNLLSAGADVIDMNVNNINRNLYIWDNTYVAVSRDGRTNSFGWDEGYNTFTVASVGWSGLGFSVKGEDLSVIDDTYWLHFAMKADDQQLHTSHQVTVSNANCIVGNSDGKLASIGDFKRDGKWYYFDIPVKTIRQFANPVLKSPATAFDDNIIAFMSGGVTDAELSFDNIFFYKSKSKEIPTYADTDASRLGKYGYKSLDDDGNAVFSFDEVGTVVPITLTEDLWKGLTSEGNYLETDLVQRDRDYTLDNNFWVWGDNTLISRMEDESVTNSTGIYTGGITSWASAFNPGWNGMGIATTVPRDLSVIDDSYYLHLSLRSDAAVGHVPVRIRLGSEDADAILTFGAYSTHPIFADFPRDGEWYSFDIPVAELKRLGQLWSKKDANGILAPEGYLLCLNTMDTYYNGSFFSFDNVFFWKKADGTQPEVSALGDYGYQSLNGEGESDFVFENRDFINFSVSEATIEMQTAGRTEEENIIAGYYTLNNWEGNTYLSGTKSGDAVNSFGINGQGWIDWVVGSKGWSGGGFLAEDGADLTVLEEGDWYLHFAMRGTDACNHLIGFAESRFTIGSAAFDQNTPVVGNYLRDNQWYSFDIPYSYIKQTFPSLYPQNNGGQAAWKGNLVWFMSGGNTGDELQLDNVFFWRERPDATGIQTAVAAEPAARGSYADAVYDLQGRRVARLADLRSGRLPKGIYVVNGKKIAVTR